MDDEAVAIHLVPSFHYDIEYLLSEEQYLEICFRNLLEAHRLLKSYDNYTFRVEQTYLLERFFQEYPSLLKDFAVFAAQGRVEVASGMYTMGDINMSSGESIIRQLVTGKTWCREHIGAEAKVLDMGDCNGHSAQMPQIARICRYEYFVFLRAVDDPARRCEIRWRGIDGSEISTYWLGVNGYAGWGYLSGRDDDQERLKELSERMDTMCASKCRLLPQGGDNHYPYEKGMEAVEVWNAGSDQKIQYSTYFAALSGIDFAEAPLVAGEWNPDRQGTYSSRIRVKQLNREAESLIYTAESISALAEHQKGFPVDTDGLTRAWKLTFVNQFHDIYWGTISDSAYTHTLNRAGRVRMICSNIIEDRLRLYTGTGVQATRRVAIFNPLPWRRKHVLRVPVAKSTTDAHVLAVNNQALPCGVDDGELTWMDTLPPCGVSVYEIKERREGEGGTAASPFSVHYTDLPEGYELAIETPIYSAIFASSSASRIEPSFLAFLRDSPTAGKVTAGK